MKRVALPIDTLVRTRRVALLTHTQEYERLRALCERSLERLRTLRLEIDELRRYASSRIEAGAQIDIQHWLLARAQEALLVGRERELDALCQEQQSAVDAAQQVLLRARKALEKLEEIAAERRREAEQVDRQREWTLLDEWVVMQRRSTR